MTEARYPIQNTITREIRSVPLRDYKAYINARAPGGGHLYAPMSDVPGVVTGERAQQTMIPKERVYEAASSAGPLQILRGDKDPAWGAARRAEVEYQKMEVARSRGFAEVAVDSFLSGASAGKFSEWANAIAGEGAGEARARQIMVRPGADFVGKATSMIFLGMIPIPGLGAVSMGAKTGLRSGSLFGLGTAAARKAGARITGEGFLGHAARHLGRPLVFAATVDGPLSFAMSRAALVDNNKEYTAQALAADTLSMYGYSIMIGGVMSIPFGLGMAAKSAAKGGGQMLSSLGRGVVRKFSRENLRGWAGGLGDAAETEMYRRISSATSKMSTAEMVKKPSGRWFGGMALDEAVNLNLTNQKAMDVILAAKSAGALKRSTTALMNSVPDPKHIPGLQYIHKHAHEIVAAKKKLNTLFADVDKMATTMGRVEYRLPKGVVPDNSNRALSAKAMKDLQDALGTKLTGQWPARLSKALNLRKDIPFGGRANVDKALKKIAPKIEPWLKQIDEFEKTANKLGNWAKQDTAKYADFHDLLGPTKGAGPTNPNSIRALIGKGQGITRDLTHPAHNAVKNKHIFTEGDQPLFSWSDKKLNINIDTYFDDWVKEIDALAKYRNAYTALQADARPLVKAKKPMTNGEILGAQVETVMTTKQRVMDTLGYIFWRGGGGRTATTFGGVMALRNNITANEKRALYRATHDAVLQISSNPATMQAHIAGLVEPAAITDMALGTALASTQATALLYLKNQLPSSQDKTILPEEHSLAEIENYFEALGAIVEPISVLATAADGSTTDQSVDALRTVYPELYTEMVIDVAEFVDRYAEHLGHAQLLGLDAFTGYALGYSDGPAPDLTYQPPYYQTTGAAQSAGAMGGPEQQRMNMQQNTTPAQKVGAM